MKNERHNKIIILTYYFPPSSAAGAQRITNLTLSALKNGWTVDILSIQEQNAGEELPNELRNSKLNIIRLRNYLHIQHHSKDRCSVALKDKYYLRAALWLVINKVLIQYNKITIGLHLYVKAQQCIRKSGVNVVISSGPPFILHRVALKLKKLFPTLIWLADFRDPWVYPGDIKGALELPENDKFRKTLNDADLVSVVTHGHYTFLKDIFSKIGKPIDSLVYAPNGSPLDLYDGVEILPIPCQASINIGHLGDITYTYRNPKALVGALADVIQGGDISIGLHFWAKITSYTRWNGESLDEMIQSDALDEHVFVHPYVARAEALSYQRSLDILVISF